MKILLIKPLVNKMKGSFGQLMLEPPLGLMYLSAFLKEHGYRDIKIIHMDAQRMDLDGLSREMETYRPDIVGISALSDESPGMFQAADRAKQYRKDCLVVAGGPHPSGDPLGTMEDRNIDLVVSGEGEQALLGIVQAYQGDRQYHLISNVYSRKANVVSSPDKVTYIQDIDSLPFPDWDAVDMASYAPFQHMSSYLYGQKYMPLFTSRGCPFQCIFCHNIFGKVFRAHSAQRVFDEIKTLHDKHGIKHFSFFDDIFNCDRQRVVDIMRMVIASPMDVRFYFVNGLRGDMLDRDLIDLFVEAGVVCIAVAVETASPRLQRDIKKNISFERLNDVIAYASRRNIVVNGAFMIGFPSETMGEVLRTIRYALFSRLDAASFFIVHPLAGTALAKRLREEGVTAALSKTNSNYWYLVSADSVNCSSFNNTQLRWLLTFANLIFYSNPVRLIRIIRKFPGLVVIRVFITQYLTRVFQVG